jgi:TrmH family RNA methyltransferase
MQKGALKIRLPIGLLRIVAIEHGILIANYIPTRTSRLSSSIVYYTDAMGDPKSNLHFVLVRTQFASNLGSTVRVMKNMGFQSLILVRPECEVGIEARSFAMKGAEILDRARFFTSLEDVAGEVPLLIGTTGRFHGSRSRLVDSPTLATEVLPRLAGTEVGLVFGSEDNGLRREELRLCQWLVEIPTAPGYSVVNLAQAAAIVACQIHVASANWARPPSPARAEPAQVESLMGRIESLLADLDLPTRISVPRLMQRIRKIAGRAQLERRDVNMLHGVLKELAGRFESGRRRWRTGERENGSREPGNGKREDG